MTPETMLVKLIEVIGDIDFDEQEEPLARQVSELIGFAGAIKFMLQGQQLP